MKTVYKYPLPPSLLGSATVLKFPAGAEFLSVGEQAGKLVLWALVNTDKAEEERTLYVVGTGHQMPFVPFHTPRFIGTVQMQSGIVLHAFESVRFDG